MTNKEMPRTKKMLEEKYKPDLFKLMSFKDGIQYELDHDVMNKVLRAITPPVIVRCMCLKVYGKPSPDPNNNTTQGRSSPIAYVKKTISHFVPNILMHWNELENPPVGNPTK